MLPTDELFGAALLDDLKFAFDEYLPRWVYQELLNDDDSRIMNLKTGYVTDYPGYLKMTKQIREGSYFTLYSCNRLSGRKQNVVRS